MAPPMLSSLSFIHDLINYSTAIFWFIAYLALVQKVWKEQNAYGLSFQSLFALVVVETSNVCLIMCLFPFHGKLVNLDFFVVDCSSALTSIVVFFYIYKNYGSTYERQRDTFGKKYLQRILPQSTEWLHFSFLYILALCVALPMFFLRRSPYAASLTQIATSGDSRIITGVLLSFWECFNDSVLALALLPQLYMFYNRRPRKVTNLLGTFVAFIFFARILAFLYWLTFPLFHDLAPSGRGIHLVTELLNILILVDFLQCYIKAKLAGQEDISLPI